MGRSPKMSKTAALSRPKDTKLAAVWDDGYRHGLREAIQAAKFVADCWPPFGEGRSAIRTVTDRILATLESK